MNGAKAKAASLLISKPGVFSTIMYTVFILSEQVLRPILIQSVRGTEESCIWGDTNHWRSFCSNLSEETRIGADAPYVQKSWYCNIRWTSNKGIDYIILFNYHMNLSKKGGIFKFQKTIMIFHCSGSEAFPVAISVNSVFIVCTLSWAIDWENLGKCEARAVCGSPFLSFDL